MSATDGSYVYEIMCLMVLVVNTRQLISTDDVGVQQHPTEIPDQAL